MSRNGQRAKREPNTQNRKGHGGIGNAHNSVVKETEICTVESDGKAVSNVNSDSQSDNARIENNDILLLQTAENTATVKDQTNQRRSPAVTEIPEVIEEIIHEERNQLEHLQLQDIEESNNPQRQSVVESKLSVWWRKHCVKHKRVSTAMIRLNEMTKLRGQMITPKRSR